MILVNKIAIFLHYYLQLIIRNSNIFLVLLIFISLIGKFVLLLLYDIPQPPDARKYINIIEYYKNHTGIETDIELSISFILAAPYMKIQPLILYLFGSKFVTILQIIISSLGIYLLFNISKIITKNTGVACLAAFLFCFNPFITYYSLLFQYETLFIFFLLLSINCFLINKKILSYLIFIFTIFINPVIEIAVPIFILSASTILLKNSLRESTKDVIIYLFIYLIFQSLMISYNYKEYGVFVRYYNVSAIALEYNEAYAEHGLNFKKISELHENIISSACPKDPKMADDFYYLMAKHRFCANEALRNYSYDYILNSDNTLQILKNFADRGVRLFSLYPYDTKELHVKIISSIYYVFLYFFLIIFFLNIKSLKKRNFYPIILLTIFALSVYILLHSVFRYRVSYDPFLIILASHSIQNLLNIISEKLDLN